jgi:hypothetical protein
LICAYRHLGQLGLKRRDEVGRVVEDTRIRVDLESDGDAMVGIVAQAQT